LELQFKHFTITDAGYDIGHLFGQMVVVETPVV
jgi:hypothetical protein